MMTLKQRLKLVKKNLYSKLPDRIIYLLSIKSLLPAYCKAIKVGIENKSLPKVQFYSDEETVDLIVNKGMSLSRYGDGELSWMSGISLTSYQCYSESFSKDLRAAFGSSIPQLLIGLPIGIFDSRDCNLYAKMWWKIQRETIFRKVLPYININKKYANTNITRPYIDYHSRKRSKSSFENIRRIWNKREVCIVEGRKTKLGMGNDLFNNASSIRRIICPAFNAYEKKAEIKDAILLNCNKNDLILMALGPTASILAVELCIEGYQVVDIGHVDIEYMWYLNHSILRDAIPGKYVNESSIKMLDDIYADDPVYVNSIITRIE